MRTPPPISSSSASASPRLPRLRQDAPSLPPSPHLFTAGSHMATFSAPSVHASPSGVPRPRHVSSTASAFSSSPPRDDHPAAAPGQRGLLLRKRAPNAAGVSYSNASLPGGVSAAGPAAIAAAPLPVAAHLEYVGASPSLSKEAYGGRASDAGAAGTDGVLALQSATAGILARHLRPASNNNESGIKGRAERPVASYRGLKSAEEEAVPPEAAVLKGTGPVISAALLDAGVDDRVPPYLLDRLLRRSRRQAATVSLLTKPRQQTSRGSTAAEKSRAASPSVCPLIGEPAAAHEEGIEAERQAAADMAQLHEPPAIQAAYHTLEQSKLGTAGTNTTTQLRATASEEEEDAIAAIVAEYAIGDKDGRHRGAVATAPSFNDQTRLAAGASSNDAAFIRRLVTYYNARSQNPGSSARTHKKQRNQKAAATSPSPRHIEVPTAAALSARTVNSTASTPSPSPSPVNGSTGRRTPQHQRPPPTLPSSFSSSRPFSLLGAVLAVSREYLEVHGSAEGLQSTSTTALAQQRRQVLEGLLDAARTRIPEPLWVTTASTASRAPPPSHVQPQGTAAVSASTRNQKSVGPRAVSTAAAADGEVDTSAAVQGLVDAASHAATLHSGVMSTAVASMRRGMGANVLFPAARPVDRSQVYILAEVLDHMLHDPTHPQWMALVTNPEVAQYVFTEGEKEEKNGGGEGMDGEAFTLQQEEMANVTALLGPPGENRLAAYTDAAQHVLGTLDAGLAEIVRQVTCYCAERGALLDLLRQSVVDIAGSLAHVLTQVKQRARADALAAQSSARDALRLEQELSVARAALLAFQSKHATLVSTLEPLQHKSDYLDALMVRVAAKTHRFEAHKGSMHTQLVQALEESMSTSASEALEAYYAHLHELRTRLAAKSNGGAGNLLEGAAEEEAPSIAAARVRAAEQREAMQSMYAESHRLLRALNDTVEATNAVCGPLYGATVLREVSPAAKTATSKWAAVARSVGAFEIEKKHRQRVYEVFTEYCSNYRHRHRPSDSSASVARNSAGTGAAVMGDMVQEFSSARLSHTLALSEAPAEEENAGSGASSNTSQSACPSVAPGGSRRLSARRGRSPAPAQPGVIITYEDLLAMDAMDCTVEEVNALFRKDLDLNHYLDGSWEQFLHDRRAGESGLAQDVHYTLDIADLRQMLGDVHATLEEVTLRLRAITKSAAMQNARRPALEPPAHPQQPCVLCRRVDVAALDAERRRIVMAHIARDLQAKVDAVEAKRRAAQKERDDARSEVKRLVLELQQAANGNLSQSNQSQLLSTHNALSGGSLQVHKMMSAAPHRQERRNTSSPPMPAGGIARVRTGLPRRPEGSAQSRRSRARGAEAEQSTSLTMSSTTMGAQDSHSTVVGVNDSVNTGSVQASTTRRTSTDTVTFDDPRSAEVPAEEEEEVDEGELATMNFLSVDEDADTPAPNEVTGRSERRD